MLMERPRSRARALTRLYVGQRACWISDRNVLIRRRDQGIVGAGQLWDVTGCGLGKTLLDQTELVWICPLPRPPALRRWKRRPFFHSPGAFGSPSGWKSYGDVLMEEGIKQVASQLYIMEYGRVWQGRFSRGL